MDEDVLDEEDEQLSEDDIDDGEAVRKFGRDNRRSV